MPHLCGESELFIFLLYVTSVKYKQSQLLPSIMNLCSTLISTMDRISTIFIFFHFVI